MSEANDIFTLEECVYRMGEELASLRRNYVAYVQPGETLKPMIALNVRGHVKNIAEYIAIAADTARRLKEFGK